MTQAYSRQAEEHAFTSQHLTFLDTLFDTRRIVNFAIAASAIGITILLMLTYLLKGTGAVLHLGILAVLMLLLLISLFIYKSMILDDPASSYDQISNRQGDEEHLTKVQSHGLDNQQNQNSDDNESDSENSSLVQVIPRKKQEVPSTHSKEISYQHKQL